MLFLNVPEGIHESQDLELKSRYSFQIVNTICAFLNTNRGEIIVGYDETKGWVGVNDTDKVAERIRRDVENFIVPQYAKKLVHIWKSHAGDKEIITVKVDHAPGEFFFLERSGVRTCFVRIGDRTLRTSSEQVKKIYNKEVNNLSISAPYEPSDAKERLEFRHASKANGVSYNKLGNLPPGNYFYKYMSLEAALISLDDNTLRFTEPSSWEDIYESRFYNAEYGKISDGKENSPKLFACCVTSKDENEAAWKIYSHDASGLASRCVRFVIDRNKFRSQLVMNLSESDVYIGKVKYESADVIDNIHEKEDSKGNQNPNYVKYFSHFTIDNYINLLLLKRPQFDHEQEVRIFILDRQKANEPKYWRKDKDSTLDQIFVKLDWRSILVRVDVDEKCSAYEKTLLVRALARIRNEKVDSITVKTYSDYYKQYSISEVNIYGNESSLKRVEING